MCQCEYDLFKYENCVPVCNFTAEDCASKGEVLRIGADECCKYETLKKS